MNPPNVMTAVRPLAPKGISATGTADPAPRGERLTSRRGLDGDPQIGACPTTDFQPSISLAFQRYGLESIR